MSAIFAKVLLVLTVSNPLTALNQVVYKTINVRLPSQEKREVVLQTEVDTSTDTPKVVVTPQTISTPESVEVAGDVTKSIQKVEVKSGETTKVIVPTTPPLVLEEETVDVSQPEMSRVVPTGGSTEPEPVVVADTTAPKVVGFMYNPTKNYYSGQSIGYNFKLTVNEELDLSKLSFSPSIITTSNIKMSRADANYVYEMLLEPSNPTDTRITANLFDTVGNKTAKDIGWLLNPCINGVSMNCRDQLVDGKMPTIEGGKELFEPYKYE